MTKKQCAFGNLCLIILVTTLFKVTFPIFPTDGNKIALTAFITIFSSFLTAMFYSLIDIDKTLKIIKHIIGQAIMTAIVLFIALNLL